MAYEGDAFISYAHIDNRALSDDETGWVDDFERILENRLAIHLGRDVNVWRDPELHGNEDFPKKLSDQLRSVATLVSIVSPGYLNSAWGRRELEEFVRAAGDSGGLQVGDKARVFKVLKTLVPLEEHPPELQPFLGYEFYRVDETGRVREFSEIFGEEAKRDFLLKLEDLARDLSALLKLLKGATAPVVPPKGTIFIAETTSELKNYRDALKRTLTPEGYAVLPSRSMPMTKDQIDAAVRDDLAACCMSIHIFGSTFGLVPEATDSSVPEIQHELAGARGAQGGFSRLVWIPSGLTVTDPRQRQLLDQLRSDEQMGADTEVLEMPFEDLLTYVAEKLKPAKRSAAPPPPPTKVRRVYLIYDQRDQAAAKAWDDLLFQSFEVISPLFDGDEREVREAHEDALRTCDGVVVLYGSGNDFWLRRKLTDLEKSPGIGRTQPAPEVCICLIAPRTPKKEQYRTHLARVVPQWDGCEAVGLEPFIESLKLRGRESAA